MSNPFDTLGMYDGELSGVFSKLKKGLKKIEKTHKKMRKKVLPKKVVKATDKIRKNKYVRGAALAVATVFAAPVVGAALGIGAGAGAGAITAKGIATTVGKSLIKTKLQSAVKKKLTKKQQRALKKHAEKTALTSNPEAVATIANAVASSPEVAEVIANMRAQGFSDVQIADAWKNSDAYKTAATSAVSQAVYPSVKSEYIAQGVPEMQAREMAEATTAEIAEDAVNTGGKTGVGAALAVGLPLLMFLAN